MLVSLLPRELQQTWQVAWVSSHLACTASTGAAAAVRCPNELVSACSACSRRKGARQMCRPYRSFLSMSQMVSYAVVGCAECARCWQSELKTCTGSKSVLVKQQCMRPSQVAAHKYQSRNTSRDAHGHAGMHTIWNPNSLDGVQVMRPLMTAHSEYGIGWNRCNSSFLLNICDVL